MGAKVSSRINFTVGKFYTDTCNLHPQRIYYYESGKGGKEMGREGIIIGAGASGLMAAITAAQRGASVTVLEHMPRPGKKL